MLGNNNDSIYLKKDWDYSPHINDKVKKGYHVKREEERRLLLDFLARRTEGALLLSGKRGVGKTSTIFSIIYDANKMLNDKKVLAILVNAPSFEIYDQRIEDEKKQGMDLVKFKRIVLQNLIRRLYTEAVEKQGDDKLLLQNKIDISAEISKFLSKLLQQGKIDISAEISRLFRVLHTERVEKQGDDKLLLQNKIDISAEISRLFRRAIAKEVKEETNLQELEAERDKIEKEVFIKLSGTEKLFFVTAASLISAAVIAFYPDWIGSWNPEWIRPWRNIISILIAAIPSIGLIISWQVKKNSISEHGEEKKASAYYLYDYDVSTLQFELEQVLRNLSENGHKVIFVIDELDKMKKDKVIDVVTSLKTLFNQASAIFILITAEDFFKNLTSNSNRRGNEYTLFSQKVYLRRPKFDEMEKFIDDIIEKPTINELATNKKYRTFRNYAYYISKTDFFDLYTMLRDHISGYDTNGSPRLDIELDHRQIAQANLQKAMGQIYSRKEYRHISDWYKNDSLLNKMYELLTRLADYKVGTKFMVEEDPILRIIFSNKSSEALDVLEVYDEIEAGALLDLINYLIRLQFLKSGQHENEYEIVGILYEVPSSPKKVHTKEENNFLREYLKFQSVVMSYAYLYNMHGQKYTDIIFNHNNFSQHREFIFNEAVKYNIFSSMIYTYNNALNPTYDNLTQVPPRLVEREILENQTNLATAATTEAINNFILVIESILKTKEIDIERVPIQEIISKFDIKVNLDIPHSSDFAVAIYPPAKNSGLFIIQTSSIPFQSEFRRIIEDTEHSSESYDYVILISTNQAEDFMEILQKQPSTSMRNAVFSFLEILDVLKDRLKNFSPPSRYLLNIEVPLSEALVDDLINGIKCYHTGTKLERAAFRSVSNEYIDSKTVTKVINQEFQNQKIPLNQKEFLENEISELTRDLNNLTVGIDTSIEKKETISRKLANLAKVSPKIAAVVLTYTPFAPFSQLVGQGVEKILQATLGSSEVQITAVSPVRGKAGELISIHGSNFGNQRNLVWFIKIPSQESDLEIPTPASRLEIEVWTEERIDVRVPKACIPGEYLIRVTRGNILSDSIKFTVYEQDN